MRCQVSLNLRRSRASVFRQKAQALICDFSHGGRAQHVVGDVFKVGSQEVKALTGVGHLRQDVEACQFVGESAKRPAADKYRFKASV